MFTATLCNPTYDTNTNNNWNLLELDNMNGLEVKNCLSTSLIVKPLNSLSTCRPRFFKEAIALLL